jgi:hypothetical protein
MTRTRLPLLALAAGALILAGPASAHHSSAIFEAGKRIEMTGIVTEWFWANPHCLLSIDVTGTNGQAVRWVVETQAPPNVIPYGWSKQSFKPGDRVTITVEPARNGRPVGRLLQAVLPDGKTLVAGSVLPPPAGAAAPPAGDARP